VKRVGVASLVLAAGCGGAPITGVHLTVAFGGLAVDQIRFTITPDGADPIVARRPETAPSADGGAWLSSPQDVMVYLPDRLAGHAVDCEAQGMASGAATPALGSASATLVLHQMVDATIAMRATESSPPPPPTPAPTATPAPGPIDGPMPCHDDKKHGGCD